MAEDKRICDRCAEKKPLSGGKTCDNSHFICKDCNRYISKCPLCQTPLK